MADTSPSRTFVDGQGRIYAAWLNGVNRAVYNVLGGAQTAAEARSALDVEDHQEGDIRNAGAIDGQDVTSIVQAALSAGGTVIIPEGTYYVTSVSATVDVTIILRGFLKQVASTAADMLTVSGTSTKVTLRGEGGGLDGNQANQASLSNYATIKWTAVGTSSDPSILDVQGVTFKNGRWADITMLGDAQRSTLDKLIVRGCKFLGGREGTTSGYAPRYIDIRACSDYVIEGNVFDFCGTPAAYGRAGILAYDGYDTTFYPSRGVIGGNHLNNVGRSEAASTLGAIDLYDTGRSTSIVGNTLVNSYGRGIQCKADCESLAIVGNAIDGLLGGSDGTMNAQIVVNGATRNVAGGSVLISSNTCIDSGRDGISVTADRLDETEFAKGILIIGNTVKGATRRGIGAAKVYDIQIQSNTVESANTGIYVQTASGPVTVAGNSVRTTVGVGVFVANDCSGASLWIKDNTIEDTGGRGVYVASGTTGLLSGNRVNNPGAAGMEVLGTTGRFVVEKNFGDGATPFTNGGTNSKLFVGDNFWETNLSFTARLLTISSGSVTPWTTYHWIETEGGAASDDLTTIAAGFDGQVLHIRPADATHTVVVKDGTGLRTAGDFSMDHSQDSMTLMWMGDTWIEQSRSDNNT